MTKVTFYAIDPHGVRHTRSTTAGREYLYTVVARRNFNVELAFARSADWAVTDGKNYDYSVKVIAKGVNPASPDWEIKLDTSNLARAKKSIDGLTRDQYIAKRAELRVSVLEAAKLAGEFNKFLNQGWCSRRDLAEKLLRKYSSSAYYTDANILPATRKGG